MGRSEVGRSEVGCPEVGCPASPAGLARVLPAVPAAVLGLLGGLFLARRDSLWYDELYTTVAAGQPVRDLAGQLLSGAGPTGYLPGVPPAFNAPYYLLMHLWLAVPGVQPHELDLRLPSLLAAVAAVAVLTRVVQRLAGSFAALTSGLTAAASPLLVEQAVEARSYGLAMLGVCLAAAGILSWTEGRSGLGLFTAAGTAAGLAHWFSLPVVLAIGLAPLLVGRRLPGALAAALLTCLLPTAALVALSTAHGTPGAPVPPAVGLALPVLAVRDLALGSAPMLVLLCAGAGLGLARARQRWLPAAWLCGPLAVLTAGELLRPLYYPRYLLPGLLALPVLAGLGLATLPAGPRRATAAALVAASVLATAGQLDTRPKERGREFVAALASRHRAGEAVVAGDPRAALALDHYVRRLAPRMAPDLRLPPEDVPAAAAGETGGGTPAGGGAAGAGAVWLVRFARLGQEPDPGDDIVLLERQRRGVTLREVFSGTTGTLVLERWDPRR